MKDANYDLEPNYYDALSQRDRSLLMKKEVELERDFGISRLTDFQEYQFTHAKPAMKMLYRLPMYDMLYN